MSAVANGSGHRRGPAAWGQVAAGAVLVAGVALAVPVLEAVPASAAAPVPSCAAAMCTVTFGFTGTAQSWVAPPGVSAATVTLDGARGGESGGASFAHQAGGKGATVVATIPVTAGDTYQVQVGGAAPGDGNEAGGYNGGGQGDGGGVGNLPMLAGGGGGASGFALGTVTLAVAGGGGGAGGNGGGTEAFGAGGPAGGTGGPSAAAGVAGVSNASDDNGGGGGMPGTATGGGAGGTAGSGGKPALDGTAGSTGVSAAGGAGGSGSDNGGGGGGGGGGYFGGGGGGGGGASLVNFVLGASGGGGGGGSDFVTSSATHVTVSDGAWSGNGQVVISYASPVVTGVRPDRGPQFGGTLVRITGTGLACPPHHRSCRVSVSFGGHRAFVLLASPATILVISPPGSGTVDVIVTVGGVSSQATAADQFTYVRFPFIF